jgi:hypothetical protein
MDSTTHVIELIAALLTPTGLLTLVVQQWLAQRAADRRDDKKRQQTIADAELKRVEVARLAAELALATATQHQAVVEKLAENAAKLDENSLLTVQAKEEAHSAFVVANTVNEKIASVGLQLADGKPLKSEQPLKPE